MDPDLEWIDALPYEGPCGPDCPECANDRENRRLDWEESWPSPPKPPRRQHLAETLRRAGKCDRCPPHGGNDNRKPGKRRRK